MAIENEIVRFIAEKDKNSLKGHTFLFLALSLNQHGFSVDAIFR